MDCREIGFRHRVESKLNAILSFVEGKRSAAAQPVSPSASGCPEARADGQPVADISSRCPEAERSEARADNLRTLSGEILATLRVNFLRGTLITQDDNQFQKLLDSWTKELNALGAQPPTLTAQRERACQPNETR